MALGAITNVAAVYDVSSGIRHALTTVVGDSAYATGGTTLTPQQLGMQAGDVIGAVCTVQGSGANNGAVQASYNKATGKLQMWATTGTSPVGLAEPNSVNLSGLTISIYAFGR